MNIQLLEGGKIAEYSQTEQALAELRGKYDGAVFAVTTTAGMEDAKAARRELVTLRTGLEKKRKALKEPALEYSRRIDAEAKRITAELEALENPIDAQIKREESRKEAEKQAKIAAERARIEAIQQKLNDIAAAPAKAFVLDISATEQTLEAIKAIEISEATFAEYVAMAQVAKDKAVADLAGMLDKKKADAAEAERLRQEREALEAEKARVAAEEAERQKAENARLAEERRKFEEEKAAQEAELAAERKRIADEAAKAKAEADRIAAEEKAKRDAEDKARREKEDAERKVREAEQAEARAKIQAAEDAARKEREDAARRERMDALSAILDVCADQSLTPAKKVTAIEAYARRALEKEQAAA